MMCTYLPASLSSPRNRIFLPEISKSGANRHPPTALREMMGVFDSLDSHRTVFRSQAMETTWDGAKKKPCKSLWTFFLNRWYFEAPSSINNISSGDFFFSTLGHLKPSNKASFHPQTGCLTTRFLKLTEKMKNVGNKAFHQMNIKQWEIKLPTHQLNQLNRHTTDLIDE